MLIPTVLLKLGLTGDYDKKPFDPEGGTSGSNSFLKKLGEHSLIFADTFTLDNLQDFIAQAHECLYLILSWWILCM